MAANGTGMQMRVATWNLEWGGRRKTAAHYELEALSRVGFDVAVLTEPPQAALEFYKAPGVVTSKPDAEDKGPWVAIVGQGIRSAGRAHRFSAAARTETEDGRRVVVYGSVLPWLGVPKSMRSKADQSSEDFFEAELARQVADLRGLLNGPDDLVIWAGDFNQNLTGPLDGGSHARRAALQGALDQLGFTAWNGHSSHVIPGLFSIDFICGPADVPVAGTEIIDNGHPSGDLTDHFGYVVDLDLRHRLTK